MKRYLPFLVLLGCFVAVFIHRRKGYSWINYQCMSSVYNRQLICILKKKVLPYRYKADEIKFTSKAVVDFQALKGYIDQIPPSAYENGGFFIYVLTNVEEKPLVRLFDLRVNDQVEKAQMMVQIINRNKRASH